MTAPFNVEIDHSTGTVTVIDGTGAFVCNTTAAGGQALKFARYIAYVLNVHQASFVPTVESEVHEVPPPAPDEPA